MIRAGRCDDLDTNNPCVRRTNVSELKNSHVYMKRLSIFVRSHVCAGRYVDMLISENTTYC